MKKLFIYIAILLSLSTVCAQERFTVGISSGLPDANTHNDTYDYALNIGAHIELQTPTIYLRARTYYFPSLNGLGYFDLDGGVGLNWRSEYDNHRVFAGGFTGLINRDSAWHPKFGLELGYEWYISDGFYVGFIADTQYKHDDKVWRHTDSGHNVQSLNFTVGYSWYYKK